MQAREALKALPPLGEIEIEEDAHITVCGDIHGQYYDLLNIFDMNGYPSHSTPYVFNGARASPLSHTPCGPSVLILPWLKRAMQS